MADRYNLMCDGIQSDLGNPGKGRCSLGQIAAISIQGGWQKVFNVSRYFFVFKKKAYKLGNRVYTITPSLPPQLSYGCEVEIGQGVAILVD